MSDKFDGDRRYIMPYLSCKQAAQAIEFYKRAFGAREDYRLMMDDGRVGHAELTIGPARFAWPRSSPRWATRAPSATAARR